MSIAGTVENRRSRIDLTRPVLWLFAACLVLLIVLPMSWLAVFAFTDKARHVTLQNFITLFSDPKLGTFRCCNIWWYAFIKNSGQ